MGTNIVSKKLSRVFLHPTKAKENADRYAGKMRARGYKVYVRPGPSLINPKFYVVDVMRKK